MRKGGKEDGTAVEGRPCFLFPKGDADTFAERVSARWQSELRQAGGGGKEAILGVNEEERRDRSQDTTPKKRNFPLNSFFYWALFRGKRRRNKKKEGEPIVTKLSHKPWGRVKNQTIKGRFSQIKNEPPGRGREVRKGKPEIVKGSRNRRENLWHGLTWER